MIERSRSVDKSQNEFTVGESEDFSGEDGLPPRARERGCGFRLRPVAAVAGESAAAAAPSRASSDERRRLEALRRSHRRRGSGRQPVRPHPRAEGRPGGPPRSQSQGRRDGWRANGCIRPPYGYCAISGSRVDTLPRSSTGRGSSSFRKKARNRSSFPIWAGPRVWHAITRCSSRGCAKPSRTRRGSTSFSARGSTRSLDAARIIGADGRASVVRQSLGLSTDPMLCSRMLGITLNDADMPFEGYGHVVLGGPGPILVYGLAGRCVRIIVDVPQRPGRSPGEFHDPIGRSVRARPVTSFSPSSFVSGGSCAASCSCTRRRARAANRTSGPATRWPARFSAPCRREPPVRGASARARWRRPTRDRH